MTAMSQKRNSASTPLGVRFTAKADMMATPFAPATVWVEFVNREPQAAGKASLRSIAEEKNEAGNSVAHG